MKLTQLSRCVVLALAIAVSGIGHATTLVTTGIQDYSGYVPGLKDVNGSVPIRTAMVFVKGTNVVVKLHVSNNNDFAVNNVIVKMTGARLRKDDNTLLPLTVSGTTQYGPYNLAAHTGQDTGWFTLTSTPGFVVAATLELNYSPAPKPLGSDGYLPCSKLYFVDQTPCNTMSTPWLEPVSNSCRWAEGLTGSTACITAIAKGLYAEAPLSYNGGQLPQWYDPSTGHFNLSLFINSTGKTGDCQDTSAYLGILCNAIGYNVTLERMESASTTGFYTNVIDPIGTPLPTSASWAFHQIVLFGGLAYDSCAGQSVDPSGVPYNTAPAGWTKDSYWQTFVGTNCYGLVNRPFGYSVATACPLFDYSRPLTVVF